MASRPRGRCRAIATVAIALAVFVTAFGIVAVSLVTSWPAIVRASGFEEQLAALVAIASRPPVAWVLYPFRLAIAPAFAARGAAWFTAMLAALALLVAHVVWVLWTDANFEEAAAEASAKQALRIAALRSRGASAIVLDAGKKRRTVRLSPNGAPWVAIIWKNYLFLQRAGLVRTMIGLPVVCAVIAVAFAGRSMLAEVMVMATSYALTAVITVFGPMSMRSDLRGELARLPILKTMPLSGRQIVLAEIAGTAVPTAVMQLLLVMSGTLALSLMSSGVPSVAIRLGVLLGAPALLLGLNLANFTIHNGMALLFPAWVRVGEGGTAGIETIGQSMLTIIVTMFLLIVMSLIPAVIGAAMYFYWRSLPLVALVFTGLIGGAVLAAESYGLMVLLGRSLERLEPSHIG